MKKIVLAAALLLTSVATFAQREVGSLTIQPKAGFNIANVTKAGGDAKFGLVAGAEAEYQLGDIYSISAGLIYSNQGSKKEVDLGQLGKGTASWSPSYLNIPVVANVYVLRTLLLSSVCNQVSA